MKIQLAIVFFSVFLFSIISCNKAGSDGNATLIVTEQHHGLTIPNIQAYPDTIYIKFNAQDLPSDPLHDYDVKFVGVVGDDHINCTTLHSGKYYIYGVGYDTTRSVRVTGGMAVKIKYGDRKKAINTILSVTE